MAMKSPCTNATWPASPSRAAYRLARSTWYSLMVTPVTEQPANLAICRAGPPAPAAHVQQHLHTRLDFRHAVRKVVLVTRDGLPEGLAVGEAAEVEGLAPAGTRTGPSRGCSIWSRVVISKGWLSPSSSAQRAIHEVASTYCLVNEAYASFLAC